MNLNQRVVNIARMVASTKRLRAAVISDDPKEAVRAACLRQDAARVDAMADDWEAQDKQVVSVRV